MKIQDIFEVKTGKRIIESEIYSHLGAFPVITAQTNNDGIAWTVDEEWIKHEYPNAIFGEEPVLTWTKDGAKCGTVFYRDYPFFCTDVCGVLSLKPEFRNKYNIKYLKYCIERVIPLNISSQNTQGKLYNTEMANMEFYPINLSLKEQDEYVKYYENMLKYKFELQNILNNIDCAFIKEFLLQEFKEYKMKDITLLNKGSNKISEENIYNNFEKNGIPIYSSATENNGLMGTVSKQYYESIDKKGTKGELTWTTNGYAGKVFYRDTDYLYSEKCGRIVIRKEFKDLINPKFLMYQLNTITWKYKTAESNNGKLDIIHMNEIPIKLPISNNQISIEKQNEIVAIYEQLEYDKEKIEKILSNISIY